MIRPYFALNVLLTSLVLSSAASAAGYQLKVSIPNLPPAVWPSCVTPWGSSLAHNGKVFAYSAESVPLGGNCDTVKEERSCHKGTLSGTFAIASCTVAPPCTPGSQTYATAGDFTFTMPVSCSSLTAKVWGAGGGGVNVINQNGKGGGGGFASGTTSLASGAVVTVVVGGAGTYGSGGGASAVLSGATEIAVGGGGGGGYYRYRTNGTLAFPGGAGGENLGLVTTHIGETFTAYVHLNAAGGTSSYGAGGEARNSGGSHQTWTGGGGGGYLGGVAGISDRGGGGGSSYALNGGITAGAGTAPGNTGDSAYAAPAGVGGWTGNPGRIVLTWQ